MRDFFELIGYSKLGIYDEKWHNKTENTYILNGNLVEFVSIDEPQKIRGRKRDYLYCNEANELPYEAWKQLIFRTTGKIIIDYNPSDEYHWIYEQVLTREDCDFYKSTYLDNPFLPDETIREIERMRTEGDDNYWRIYGLGERAVSSATIYTSYGLVDSFDQPEAYGLDFGFNHPTVLIQLSFPDGDIVADELLYASGLTTADLIVKMNELGISKTTEMFCDHARPEAIEELCRAGYNAKPANKAVYEGISFVKGHRLKVTKRSLNTIKELRSYKWKETADGRVLDEPVKLFDDAMDAIRYGAFSYHTREDWSFITDYVNKVSRLYD
jgi:phage terminase large subunit